MPSYKPDISIQHITAELAFSSPEACCQFICECGGENLLEAKDGSVRFNSAKAGTLFEKAKAEIFRTVDIKGQI